MNPNRGIDDSVIDTDRATLAARMKAYFGAASFADAAKAAPIIATVRARYNPEEVWGKLRSDHSDKIAPFLVFPFDQRWLHYETEHKFLNEARADLGAIATHNEFLVTVPEPRKISETRPVFSRTLVNLHVHERGSVVIPREVAGEGLFAGRIANIAEPAWAAMRDRFGLAGRREDDAAKAHVGRLLRVILALLHAPRYQDDHKSALSADWAHPPLSRDPALFAELAEAGDLVATLLDADADAGEAVRSVLGDLAAQIAPLRAADGGQVTNLAVTISYWGGAKGRWSPRPFHSDEAGPDALGEKTGDLYLNPETFLANVPAAVWQYQLGGYPVIKKWLGYRQADRRGGNPLTLDEAKWLRAIAQRIAALLVLGDRLDALYARAAEDAFTAEELGLRR